MNHEEILKAIQLRSTIENLDVDVPTIKRLLSQVDEPKSLPWDLVSETIKAREEAVSEGSVLDNMIAYYKAVAVAATWRLEEAQTLKESLTSHAETSTVETWGRL